MFHEVTLRGMHGAILWGYRPAAEIRAWAIAKIAGQWTLTATLTRAEAFMLRQTPLLFTAPHEKGRDGFWAWGVESVQLGPNRLIAKLGPPEQ